MKTGEICNREVVFVERAASISEAARLMRAHHVGDLVVVKEKNGGASRSASSPAATWCSKCSPQA